MLAVLYTVACVVTLGSGRLRVRPLFEGFTPPQPYQWVNPPNRFKAGNVKPSSASATIPIENGSSAARALTTGEGQFLANLGAGAITSATATEVQAKATPVDPGTLGRLPAGLFPDGNAYRFDLTLSPGAAPVGSLAAPGNIVLVLPANGTAIAFSPDGQTWQQLPTQPVGNTHTTLGVSFDRPGYFLGVATADVTGVTSPRSSSSGGSSTGTIVLVAAGVVILLAALVGGPVLWRRRTRMADRRPATRRPPPKGAAGRRPPSKSTGTRNKAKGGKGKGKGSGGSRRR